MAVSPYHAISLGQLFKELQTNERGLTSKEAMQRLNLYGKNKLARPHKRITAVALFLDQWKSPLLIVLLITGLASGLMREWVDMGVILGTAFLNALIGYIQEYKAHRALHELERLVQYTSLVIRDEKKIQIKSEELVPGDIIHIIAGDKISADGRIIEEKHFLVNESALTGESEPVKKHSGLTPHAALIAQKKNMVFCGTIAVNGHATILLTATGKNTELGIISALVALTKKEPTPLQEQLGFLSKQLTMLISMIALTIFIVGAFFIRVQDHTIFDMFQLAIAVAVAAIPEGLVISLTVTLSVAMRQIFKKNALVRKLLAAETLGSVSIICTDKTGTITRGTMQVTRIITHADDLNYEEIQLIHRNQEKHHEDALTALHLGAICNEAVLAETEQGEIISGDTTDAAFIEAARHAGYDKKIFDEAYQHLDDILFDNRAKYMARYDRIDHVCLLSVKGAPEVIMERSRYIEKNGERKKISKSEREIFLKHVDSMTSDGLRVIALAYKDTEHEIVSIADNDVDGLVFVGLVALSDPLRHDAKETMVLAAQAGIRTIIVTGDHRKTACAIALQVGIPVNEHTVIDGSQLNIMDDPTLAVVLEKARVFARLDPAQKIRIVRILQSQGHVVSMTGDGVNDAPALRAADIGVALGSGTDVAKETADIILLDDSLHTIITAIEEGRTIYQNIKKILLYLLSNGFTEVIIILGSLFTGNPIALIPVQILWVNLIQDSIPTIALAFDKGDAENMHEPPRNKKVPLIDREMGMIIFLKSLLANIVLFGMFIYYWRTTGDIVLTRTIIFVGITIDTLFYIFSIRSLRKMVWRITILNNPYIIISVLFGWIMLVLAIYVPFLQRVLQTVPLSAVHWATLLIFGFCNLLLFETMKWFYILFRRRQT